MKNSLGSLIPPPPSSNLDLARLQSLIRLIGRRSKILFRQNSNHGKESPCRVGRLRAYTYPVLCAVRIQLDVLVQPAGVVVGIWPGHRVICAQDFEG